MINNLRKLRYAERKSIYNSRKLLSANRKIAFSNVEIFKNILRCNTQRKYNFVRVCRVSYNVRAKAMGVAKIQHLES